MKLLARAYDYPYERPRRSMIVRPGRGWDVVADDELVGLAAGRTPVIACGSNGAPAQLARKFAGTDEPVLVLSTGLVDHDAVFTAHITRYGAVPAALHPSPGTVVHAHVTFLTDQQLVRMDATEHVGVNYDRRAAEVELATAVPLDDFVTVELYHARTPPLCRDGEPVAHAVIAADDRVLAAMPQREVLRRIAAAHGTDDLDAFVTRLATDDDHRNEVEQALLASADTALG